MLRQTVQPAIDLQVQKRAIKNAVPKRIIPNDDADNFLGIGKKAKARKAVRVENRQKRKMMKAEDRSYKKRVKADALALKTSGNAQAKIIEAQANAAVAPILAAQGIQQQPQESALNTALNAAGGLFNNQPMQAGNGDVYNQQAYQEEQYQNDQLNDSSLGQFRDDQDPNTGKKKSNTTLYMIIAGVVLIAAFIYFKKK